MAPISLVVPVSLLAPISLVVPVRLVVPISLVVPVRLVVPISLVVPVRLVVPVSLGLKLGMMTSLSSQYRGYQDQINFIFLLESRVLEILPPYNPITSVSITNYISFLA